MQNSTAFILFLRKKKSGKGASEKQFESGEKKKKQDWNLTKIHHSHLMLS